MEKLKIFDDIVRVVHEDSSSCKDKTGVAADVFRTRIHEDMDDISFVRTVRSYLATFGLTGHLYFNMPGMPKIPFLVKKYEGELYVFDASEYSPLKIGDRITHIDGMTVDAFGAGYSEYLIEEKEERQGSEWRDHILPFSQKITYVHEGESHEITTPFAETWGEMGPLYECKDLGNNTVYMKLEDFNDEETIQKMYADNEPVLLQCKNLIIDVRTNAGGKDTAYFPLFKYALDNGKSIGESCSKTGIATSKGTEINYTARNCELRLALLKPYLEMDLPEETKNVLSDMIKELEENRGKGFVSYPSSDEDEDDLQFRGDSKVEKVIIITSEDCGSSGDSFVENFSPLNKVTVIGRPTMGILDYSNCTMKNYDSYTLVYPTSRRLDLDCGDGMMGKGIKVDEYIPWTPEHLKIDIMLERALELI